MLYLSTNFEARYLLSSSSNHNRDFFSKHYSRKQNLDFQKDVVRGRIATKIQSYKINCLFKDLISLKYFK